ncbi:MAG: AAA family ATPase [Chitinophagaceae bacterium]|nr:AAA family ATPase [Chitinophagaceae bacterium]
MRILAIRVKNLASLEGVTEIDFTKEPLFAAGIYAITGPTGAGKSTILDALCLALYAKTPRYKLAESGIEVKEILQNDVRGILRDGSAEGFAEVDFVGTDQQHYRANWSVRRARNRADGNLQAYEIILKNISTQNDILGRKSEILQEIERLVGLNFEQFTRSVLLAQGDFSAFLKAGKDEKSSLLEKLTGTQVYSVISMRIFERHKEEQQRLHDLNLQREGIPTLTPEELEQLVIQKGELATTIQKQEHQVNELNIEISWYEKLSSLQANMEAAARQQELALNEKEEARPRLEQLQKAELVQNIRTPTENQHSTKQQLVEQLEQSQNLQEVLDQLLHKQELNNQILQQAVTALKEKAQEQEAAKSLLDRAKALDVQLSEKQRQMQQADEDLKGAQAEQKKLSEILAIKQREAEVTAEEIGRLIKWKADNASRQAIAEHESLILSKLNDAGQLVESGREASIKLQQITQETEQLQMDRKVLEQQQADIEAAMQKARQQYEATQTALAAVHIQVLEQEKLQTDAAVQQLAEAAAHWQLLYATQQELTRIVVKLEVQQQELNRQREQIDPTDIALNKALLQKETVQQMLDKAWLAASESIEQLRTQLSPGEPCPVCGSLNHPYVSENPQLHHVLTELKAAYQEKEQVYLGLLGTQSRLQHAVTKLVQEITSQEEERNSRQQQVASLETTWKKFSIHAECMEVSVSQRYDWLRTLLLQRKKRQEKLQEQLEAVKQMQRKAELQRDECDRLDKSQMENVNKVKDITRDLQFRQEQMQQQSSETRKFNDILTAIQAELSKYFTSSLWFTNWSANHQDFIEKISRFTKEWRTNLQKLDSYVLGERTLVATLDGLREQASKIANDTILKEQNYNAINLQYQKFKTERSGLFEGRAVVDVELMLREALEIAQRFAEKCRAERNQFHEEITRITAEKGQKEKYILILRERQAQLHEQVHQWLQAYNRAHTNALTAEALDQLLQLTPDWIEAERAALRELDDALTRAQSVVNERKTALEHHLLRGQPEQPVEDIQRLLIEVRTSVQQFVRQQNEVEIRLEDDAVNKHRIRHLLQGIESQAVKVDNWGKLNEVIGSADGKKFRQAAQEYTLDVLLSFANVHLGILSRRYMLQRIPNTLGLQVVDRDMGDEVRTVYSLSGGESFLVSLALALGLASISSTRMQVESLFIDEGFGSLDPNTLNIAMDALERLNQQGRKVGVISHVQEMTERIPVQIKVSKRQSGRSMVEIIGVK